MTITSDDVKRRIAEREKRASLSSSASIGKVTANDVKRRMAERDFASLKANDAASTIQKVYGGWNSADDMASYKQSLVDFNKKATDYTTKYGDVLNEQQSSFFNSLNDAVNQFDDTAALYGYYKTADAFNAAMEKQKKQPAKVSVYDSKYKALTNNADFDAVSPISNYEKKPNKMAEGSIEKADFKRNAGSPGTYLYDLDEERQRVGKYIFEHQGEEAYNEYMNTAGVEYAKEKAQADKADYEEWAKANPGKATLKGITSTLKLPAVAAEGIARDAKLLPGEINIPYSPYVGVTGSYLKDQAGVEAVAQQINDNTGWEMFGTNVPSFLYQNFVSMGQSRVGNVLGPGYTALMGAGAAASTYADALERGLDEQSAVKTALAAGAAESVFEVVSLGMLLKNKDAVSVKTIVSNFLKQFVAEGSEEFFTDISNRITDGIINGDESEYNQTIQSYVDRGFTQEEATKMADKEFVRQLAESFIGGGISGGLSSGGLSTLDYVNNVNTGKNVNRKAYEEAMRTANENSTVYEDYLTLMQKYDQDLSKATNAEIGKSYRENLNESIKSVYESKSQEEVYDNLSKYSDMALAGDKKAAEEAVVKNSKQFKEEYVQKLYTDNYKGQQLKNYDTNFRMIITDAAANISVEEMLKDINTSVISKADAMSIYQAAVEQRITSDAAVRNLNNEMMAKWNGKYKGGSIKFGTEDKEHPGVFKEGSIEDLKLTSQEKQLVGFFNLFAAKGMKINVIADDSSTSSNGFHTNDDGSITVNLRARFYVEKQSTDKDNEYAIPTFAHESTHWMEDILGDEFNTFRDIVKNFMGTAEWNDAIARQKKAGTKNENIESEIIARFCEGMIDDASVVDRLVTTADESKIRRVIKAVRKWFSELREDIQKLIKGYSPQSEEAKYARQFEKEFKAIQDMWVDMFQRALVKNQVVSDYAENESTQFSGKQTIESDGKLIAMHNLTMDQLLKTVKLGGFALPSIAIMKQYMPHTEYGDVTVVFPKTTVSAEYDKRNKVYSGDAWTPTFPTIDKKISRKEQERIQDKITSLVGGREVISDIGNIALDYDNMMDMFSRNDTGYDAYGHKSLMKYAYLQDTGKGFDIPKKEKAYSSYLSNESLGAIALVLGKDTLNSMKEGYSWYSENSEAVDRLRLLLNEAYLKEHKDKYDSTDSPFVREKIKNYFGTAEEGLDFSTYDRVVRSMISYSEKGAVEITDTKAFDDKINEYEYGEDYKKWVDELFSGAIEKEGIRNNLNLFKPNGTRRDWEALHGEVNLENIAKAMLSRDATGVGGLGGNNFFGAAVKTYKNVEEMRKDMGRLMTQNQEEREALRHEYFMELEDIADSIKRKGSSYNNDFELRADAVDALVDTVRHSQTLAGIDKYLKKEYGDYLRLKADTSQRLYDLFQKIANMPTEYYEAKPMRVVSLDEVSYVVIPNNAPASLIKALNDNGITYKTFEAGNDDDRVRVVNENASEAEGTLFNKKTYRNLYSEGDDFSNSLTEEDYSRIDQMMKKNKGITSLSGEHMLILDNKLVYNKNNKITRVITIYGGDSVTIPFAIGDLIAYERNKKYKGLSFAEVARAERNYVRKEFGGEINIYADYGNDTYTDSEIGLGRKEPVRSRANYHFEDEQDGDGSDSEGIKRSSKVNSEGQFLTEAQAEYFADSKIRDDKGNLIKVYHGSDEYGFTVFDTLSPTEYGSHFGTKAAAARFDESGEKTYEGYLNITNPIRMPDIFGNVFKLSDYVNTIHGRRDQLIDGKLLNGVTREPIKITNTKQQLPINEAFEEYSQAAQDLAYDDFGDEILVAELAQAYLKSLRFDGVIYENAFEDKGNDSYMIFDAEQFKRADNLNPTKDRDMRFSQKINSEGDKLTEGQAAYFKNSKVRDDDGNLKVMYHGSRSAGFTIFQRMYSDDNRSFFFTDKKSIAYGYNSTNEEYIPDKHYSYEELASMISGYTNGEQYLEKNGKKIILNYYEEESYEEKQREYDSLDAVRDDFIDYINRFRGVSAPATYKVYLNATNPLVIDADFNNWDEITPGEFSKEYRQLHIVRDGDTYSIEYDDEDWNHHEETLTAKEFDKRFGYGNGVSVGMGQEEDYEWLYVDKYGDVIPTNTRGYSAFAKAHGYDSVIFNNIVDTGIYAPDFNEVSQVVVVFDANQIKSVANVNPTEDEDIRFSQKVMPDDIFGVNKELEKENEKLRNDIDRLKKKLALERKVTNGGVLDESKLELAVKKILKEANSSYDKETLKKELKEFYEGILNSKTPETLNWDSLMGQAEEIARKVFAKQRAYKYTDDYAASMLADIRRARIRLTDEQKQEARNAYGDDWRNAFLGRIMIVNDGMSLDSYWSEWSEMYPWVFDADVNPNDQITALSEIYDDLRRLKESEVYYRGLEERRALAIEIYNQFWNIPTVTTISDKYSKDISRLKLQHRQEMEQLRKEHTSSISEIKKEASEQKLADSIYYGKQLSRQQRYYQDAIKRIREEKNQQLADYKEYVKNRNISEKEANARKSLVNKITNESMTLMDWMNKNSKKEHVPEALKPLVKEFVGAIDYSSRRALGQVGGSKAGIPTQKDKSLRRAIDRIYKMVLNSNTEEGMTELETFVHFPDAYKERLAELSTDVNTIAAKLGEDNEYVLNEMTVEQLESLYEAVRLLKTVVTSLNKAIAGAYNYTIASTAQEDIQYHKELGSKKSKSAVLEFLRKFFKWDSALPIYAFDYLGPGAQKMFTEVQDGWDKFSFNIKKVIAFAEESFTPEQRKAWSEEIKDFEVLVLPTEAEEKKGGKAHKESIQMTTAQVMSLYCLSKREHAKAHFAGGGIRVATIKNKGKEIVQTKNVRLSEEALEDIISSLTKEQIAVADKLQEFMNTVCSDWGNEVTMKLYGIKGYTEKNYFPIKVDSNILPTDNRDNEKSIYALLNMSFTKPIKPHANNQMEIGDIFDVFTIHTSEMAKYNSIALPVLDMVKWYSYKEKDQDGNVTALKGSIEQTFGKDAKSYIMHFLNDLNGNQESGRGDSYLKKLTRAYKTSAVAANLQVAALQPISIFRATAVMDGKYLFMGANPAKIKRGMQKAAKYSGIANWKSMSLFDTNVSRGLDAKIKRDDNWYDKTIEASMKLAEIADEVTWGAIWNACEYEVAATSKLEGEAFYEAVNKRFRDVIYRTQVVDSTMTRTDLMRSSSLATQWVTSFMSEPSVGLNVLTNAVVKFNQDSARFGSGEALKRNGKIIRMAAVGYSLSALAEGILRGLAAKWRDWDDDDTTVLQKMWQEFWSNMNILNNIPVVKDVISIFKGYNVNRMDVSWAQSAYYAFTSIQKNGITYKSVYRIIQAVSGVSGVPLANAMREVKTLWNNTIGNFYPDLKFKD